MTRITNTLALALTLTAGSAAAEPLDDSGDHLPIPDDNPDTLNIIGPTLVETDGGFTGTWTDPALPDWRGTFTAEGPIPGGTNYPTGTTNYDFTQLPPYPSAWPGNLAAGSYMRLNDLDGGSGNGEWISLRAFEATGDVIEDAWLNEPVRASDGGNTSFNPDLMPSWDFTDGTYTFEGSDFQTSLSVWFTTNRFINELEVIRGTANANFKISAPVPAPARWPSSVSAGSR